MDRLNLVRDVEAEPTPTATGVPTAAAAVVDDIRSCLAQLRKRAEQAERARLSGSRREVEDVHAAARALLDRISIALLAGGTEGSRTAAVLEALGASCAAEFSWLEGRCDVQQWRTAVQRWEAVALQQHQMLGSESL